MIIRPAKLQELDAICGFYDQMIDEMRHAAYAPGWKKDVYPSRDYLWDAVSGGALYVGTVEERVVAAMIINHACNESYRSVLWPTEAGPEEVTVIHTLGVLPSCAGKGYAKQLVRKALELAAEEKQKAVRLDVLKGNLPAEKLYAGLGFQYVDTIQMFYEDTGWTDFLLYEYPLIVSRGG